MINKILQKLPEHVFSGIDKDRFLDFVGDVFLKIENLNEIHIPAAISFLKLKFMYELIDVDLVAIMIKKQCKK